MNEYYDDSGAPSTGAPGSSAVIRAEFDAIQQGFDKLPPLTGNDGLPVFVNPTGSALEAISISEAKSRLGIGGGSNWCGTATGTANALILTPSEPITSYVAGQTFLFKSGASPNSGVTTVSISGLGTIAIQVNGAACVGGEIAAARWYEVLVDATLLAVQLNKIGRATLTELGISTFAQTILDDVDAAAVRATIGAAIALKTSANVASASTVDLTGQNEKTVVLTGTTTVAAWTMTNGQVTDVICAAATPLTYNVTTNKVTGGAGFTTSVGDTFRLFFDGTTVYYLDYVKFDGTPIAAGAITAASTAEVSARTNNTKTVTAASLLGFVIRGTAVATTSGTSIDFTGLPAGLSHIEISLVGVQQNSASDMLFQIGDSGGIENTGYLGAGVSTAGGGSVSANYTTGMGVTSNTSSAVVVHGTIVLTIADASTNTWTMMMVNGQSNSASVNSSGASKSLTATLDRFRLTTVSGAGVFTNGKMNYIAW